MIASSAAADKRAEEWSGSKISENVVVGKGGAAGKSEELGNLVVVSTQQPERTGKLNTSTITIISDLTDPSNSLAANISQVSFCVICNTHFLKIWLHGVFLKVEMLKFRQF